MATNLSLDPKLIEQALEVSGERTKEGRGHPCAGGIHRPPQTEAAARTNGQTGVGELVRLQGRTLPQVTLIVDTSVWSLALRRDAVLASPGDSEAA